MNFPIKNSNSRYVKTVTNYEKSTWYMKRRANNNKRVAKMVVQKSGARKGSYVFNAFSGNGKRMTVDYDSRKKLVQFMFKIVNTEMKYCKVFYI